MHLDRDDVLNNKLYPLLSNKEMDRWIAICKVYGKQKNTMARIAVLQTMDALESELQESIKQYA